MGNYPFENRKIEIINQSSLLEEINLEMISYKFGDFNKYNKVIPEKLEGIYGGTAVSALSIVNRGFMLINKVYLDYLTKVGYDEMRLPQESMEIYFMKDGKTKGILMPLNLDFRHFRTVAKKEDITKLLEHS